MLDDTDRETALDAVNRAIALIDHGSARRALGELQKARAALGGKPHAPRRPGWPIRRIETGAPMVELPDPSVDELARLSRAVHALGG